VAKVQTVRTSIDVAVGDTNNAITAKSGEGETAPADTGLAGAA